MLKIHNKYFKKILYQTKVINFGVNFIAKQAQRYVEFNLKYKQFRNIRLLNLFYKANGFKWV